jgi:hypothetical protein
VGDSAVRLLVTLGARSAWWKAAEKDCPTAKVLLEAKAAALHPKRYQSSLSKLSTKGEGRGGEKKRRQSDWPANQIDRKVIDRLKTDRQVEIGR